jgi:L-fuconolactonase
MKIDSHQHFWKYNPVEYAWIDESMYSIRRDFLPEHLRPELVDAKVDGVISVQARQDLSETGWLLDLAARNNFIQGVVGWVDLVSPQVCTQLERCAAHPKLKGVRHVIHDEPDDDFVLRKDFSHGISELKPLALAYDLLIFERHLPQTIKFVDAHPGQVFILDHIAKPRIRKNVFEPWNKNIRELARRQNVYCKLSGMVTGADPANWTEPQLRPYFETVLEAFTPRRLMFGSDWPVCLPACPYARWQATVADWVSRLSAGEQGRIFGGTASDAYRL